MPNVPLRVKHYRFAEDRVEFNHLGVFQMEESEERMNRESKQEKYVVSWFQPGTDETDGHWNSIEFDSFVEFIDLPKNHPPKN